MLFSSFFALFALITVKYFIPAIFIPLFHCSLKEFSLRAQLMMIKVNVTEKGVGESIRKKWVEVIKSLRDYYMKKKVEAKGGNKGKLPNDEAILREWEYMAIIRRNINLFSWIMLACETLIAVNLCHSYHLYAVLSHEI